jgi:hypothetical protein
MEGCEERRGDRGEKCTFGACSWYSSTTIVPY